MSDGKYIQFNEVGVSKSGLTKLWEVINKENGTLLGKVGWYGPWRQYAFFPDGDLDLVFERNCLRGIANFCELKTREHNKRRKEPF